MVLYTYVEYCYDLLALYTLVACGIFFASRLTCYVFLLVHCNEENYVLQHACANCSKEPGRNPLQTTGEEENSAAVT